MVSSIKIVGRTIEGLFQERINCFLTLVNVENKIVPCFLPNPGRIHELIQGTKVILKMASNKKRKTEYDLIGFVYNCQRISVDSRVPNKLVLEALKRRDIEELSELDILKTEYRYNHSRFDFFLANEYERCLLEVKSCTLVKDGVAMFPDAKTKRGRSQLIHLMKAKKEGYRTCILFIIQRTDTHVFLPNDDTDPEFGKALRSAALENVEVYAYDSEYIENVITLKGKVKVRLDN